MQVTQVALCPTDASNAAHRPALTPELLAATGARYSRSNDGLDAILAKIDPQNMDKSVDSIFKMVDYGHQSIADMAPVAMFMDGISMWLAYHIWSLCPTAGGQESSTRYLKLSRENLPDAAEIGIPENLREEWKNAMESALAAYETALAFWEDVATKNETVMRIPREILEDKSEKAQKTVARMRRNYAFDRARYFLPAALKTNVMMVQSARAWVNLCQQLLSHPLPEAQLLGEKIREELALVAPRLIKHAAAQSGFLKGNQRVFSRLCESAFSRGEDWGWQVSEEEDEAFLSVFTFPNSEADFVEDLEFHDNRYAFVGPTLQETPVQFGWSAVTFGDIRDLNRHRTGTKTCDLVPVGFYGAREQSSNALPAETLDIGHSITSRALALLAKERKHSGFYWFLLGSQFSFQHTTTADKFIYEAELRTGLGAHYRYAKHLHDVLELWYQKFPATRGLILEGAAEPE
ncbi:Thymidylate synthase ThyX [Abditibacterium utsteinense]|uniref:Thymidylate synthase ThyX n=1 Tax=Abditibacterium utsteinense TaxID=1960156 RepID=A0A2S8SRQ2_9BACT|nr:FAD-dependent thymidylate synthase [Abditibacterium utsteinense]PQV63429.1 Thymidylate synthase ThyX [Abditibacterium utsteinense]